MIYAVRADVIPAGDTDEMGRALAHLAEHGWARLGRVAGDDVLAALRARADDLMLGRARVDGLFFQPDSDTGAYGDLAFGKGWVGPTLAYRKLEKLERDDLFRALVAAPRFEQIARAAIPGDIAIYRAALFAKSGAGGTELPWHQDGGRFWGIDRDATLQVWLALDDCPPEAGCVEVLPGSHRGGLATPDGGNVPAAVVAAAQAEAHALALPATAGEVLLLHNHTWHRSGRNATGRMRRAVTICYMSAATRCLRRRRPPREFFRPFAG
jgi:ectoine hydroxylase-related dioxygenase (phytanoyl-CoA dioxygenase family)